MPPKDDPNIEAFEAVWLDTVFCDSWTRAFNKAGESNSKGIDDYTTTLKPLRVITRAFCEAYDKNLPPADLCEVGRKAREINGALLSLVCHRIGVFGSNLDLLKCICGEQPHCVKWLPRLGKVIAVKMRSAVWQKLVKDYSTHFASSIIYKSPMDAAIEKATRAVEFCESNPLKILLEDENHESSEAQQVQGVA